ncbi:MAG TPA: hypothetical protein GXX40_02230 [Firmicutes bacterium]|nr:hypothetical protein [Bacillota bacterium]
MRSTIRNVMTRTVLVLALTGTIVLAGFGHAFALSSEDQQAYNEWYFARFGVYPGQVPGSAPAPGPSPSPQPSPQPGGTPVSVQPAQPTAVERGVLDLLNRERARLGLRPLQMDPTLVALARLKGEDMVRNGYYAHYSPTYGYSWDMLRKFGISFKRASENICVGGVPSIIHETFMGSTNHRTNMLRPYWTRVGIGLVPVPGSGSAYYGYYVVELFVED